MCVCGCFPSLAHFPAGNQVFGGDSGEQEVMVSVLMALAAGPPAPPPPSDSFGRSRSDTADKRSKGNQFVSGQQTRRKFREDA